MTDTITLPRSVVAGALHALDLSQGLLASAGSIHHITVLEEYKSLRTALTEALAQPIQTLGCTSNCENCTYAHGSPAHAGYCYMFYDEPQGVCSHWKDANHSVSVNDMVAQPVREPVAWWITGKKTDEKFVTTRPDDWSNKNWNKHQLYAAPQPVREPLSDEWIRERTKQLWVFETVKQWVKEVELAHCIGCDK